MEKRNRRRVLLVCAAALALLSVRARAQSEFQVFLSLLDADDNPPRALTPADVQVTEGGAAATVLKVEPIDWPVKVQVIVDNGSGLGKDNLLPLRTGLRGLFEWLPAGVDVSFYTTAPQPRVLVRPTTRREALIEMADRLAFDSATGRFVDSLDEATRRIDADGSPHYPVIVAIGTTGSDATIVERSAQLLLRRLEQRSTVVHTVLLESEQSSRSFGSHQTQLAAAMRTLTGGRFEPISAATRLESLLPEIGAQITESHRRQSRQFRLTLGRPAGKSGPLGPIGGLVPKGYRGRFTLDGVLP